MKEVKYLITGALEIEVFDQQTWDEHPEERRTAEVRSLLKHTLEAAGYTVTSLLLEEAESE